MNENRQIAIQIEGLKKRYRLGLITASTFKDDIARWWAKVRHKEDPTLKVGQKKRSKNKVFMALDGIDLTVYKGDRVGIIGHNGAGKSTLLKLLSRVTGPTEGEIRMNGRVSSMLEVGTGFNGELTGRENIYLNGAILGMSKAEVNKKMDQIIEFSECAQFIDTPVKRYSSGMFVKLAFAVAAHLDSEIMIMDEVLAVGDINFQQKCLRKMRDVAVEEGKTVLYVSHNMATITQLCNRCIVLDHGKKIFDGDTAKAIEIYSAKNDIEQAKEYDLVNIERIPNLTALCHLNKITVDKTEVQMGEPFVFNFVIDSKEDINNALVRLVLYKYNGEALGMTYTEKFSLKKGINVKQFLFNTDSLVFGEYYFDIIVADYNNGIQTRHDAVPKVMLFNVTESDYIYNAKWDKQCWGNIRLPETKVKNIEGN